jgi:hypothetical protein
MKFCHRHITDYFAETSTTNAQALLDKGVESAFLQFTETGWGSSTSRLLKKFLVDARQGGNGRKSAVYWHVHEHFEPISNAAWRRQRVFQQPARGEEAARAYKQLLQAYQAMLIAKK